MFDRVLVSMDLSPATQVLVSSLPGLSAFGTEEINLVHVAKPVEYPASRSLRVAEELRSRVRRLANGLEQKGFRVTVDVPMGAPAAEATRLSEQRNASVIMVGSRSHSRVRDAFIGSVAWEIVRRSERPVLFVPIEPARPDPEAALETLPPGLPRLVVYPTDFSDAAARAMPAAEALARLGVRDFVLLHVLRDHADAGREDDARARLEELAGRLGEAGAANVRLDVRRGDPAEEVLRAGGRDPNAMVVMGTHGRGFLPEIVLGSQSRQVVRHAASPVLLVPSRAA